jgi:hypothetical protein
LRAVQIDFGDVFNLQQALAKSLGDLFHLGVVGALGREHIEDRIDIAVFVIDRRANQARGQIVFDVADFLPQLIKQLRNLARRRIIFESNLHRGKGRLGVGRDLVEIRQLLQFFFDRVGDLSLHLGGGCSWPHGGDHRYLDGERRILGTSQAPVGKQACHAEHDNQEQNQGGVSHRPC